MKKEIKRLSIYLITFFLLFGCGEDGSIGLVEFGSLTGKVVDKEGFLPLENVKIILSPTSNTTFTDAEGNFVFKEVEAQEYSVQAVKDGYLDDYQGASVSAEVDINIVFELEISTAFNKSPLKPELLAPEDGVLDLSNEVELSWESSDIDEDELVYTIEIRNDYNDVVTRITDIKDQTYTLSDLKYGAKYFWSIEVTDNINTEVTSSIRTFTVKGDPENRYFYVKIEGGNNVIYSASYNDLTNEVYNEVQLTNSSLNSWRPRKNNISNLVAFLRNDNNEAHLYTMKANGDEVKKITAAVPLSGFNLNEMDFSWSPDGSKLLYSSFYELYVINKDGSGLKKIHETIDGSLISECDWSDNGSKIAVKTNKTNGYDGSIYTIDVNGNIIDTVITDVKGALGGLNFSASGNKLLFTRDVSNHQASNYRQLDTRIFIYNFTNFTFVDITDDDKESGTNDLDPRFSPNEAYVIFMNTSNDGMSQKNIIKTNLTGNIQRKTLFTNGSMPDWE